MVPFVPPRLARYRPTSDLHDRTCVHRPTSYKKLGTAGRLRVKFACTRALAKTIVVIAGPASPESFNLNDIVGFMSHNHEGRGHRWRCH